MFMLNASPHVAGSVKGVSSMKNDLRLRQQ